jgi:hypothetical protein
VPCRKHAAVKTHTNNISSLDGCREHPAPTEAQPSRGIYIGSIASMIPFISLMIRSIVQLATGGPAMYEHVVRSILTRATGMVYRFTIHRIVCHTVPFVYSTSEWYYIVQVRHTPYLHHMACLTRSPGMSHDEGCLRSSTCSTRYI